MTASTITSVISVLVMGIVLLVGVVLTARARRDHGSAAMIGLAGCIVLLLGVLFNILRSWVLIPMMADSFGMSIDAVFSITTPIAMIFDAGGTGLLIWAVVARRKPSRPTQPPHGPQGPGWQQPPAPPANWQQQPPYGGNQG
ncbi:proline-rich domain-containing protein [Nonomuraea sp. NPDC049695]|uniref:proline-rich domain-containing protein n=1 Tax=Nonomuraea sp. NPDC049695 TaxID=3154734 RepID=UPI003447CDE0